MKETGSFEDSFNSLQQLPDFFIFEVFVMIYIMMVLAFVADEFLMPSLKNIAKKYNLSKDLTGFIVALGNLVPELTTTILSFLRHGVKMTEFAIATNIGSSLFAITVVPAIGALFAPPIISKLAEKGQEISPKALYRDLGFFVLSLIIYTVSFSKGICSFNACCFLISLVFVYLGVVAYMNQADEN